MAKRAIRVTSPGDIPTDDLLVLLPDSTIEEVEASASVAATSVLELNNREEAIEAIEKSEMAKLDPFWAAFVVSELGGKLVRVYDRGGDVAYLWTLRGEYPAVGR